MGSKPKKSKTYRFNEEWEIDYLFTMVNDKCCCLICLSSIAIAKKGNLERHFLALHNKYQTDYPSNSELRKRKIRDLKTQLTNQQNIFTKPILKSQRTRGVDIFNGFKSLLNEKKYLFLN
ncbi:Spin-doc zinc-finger [Popillia japonica]|uniref:Spin-doc zinc-finger n=1 Tax=Popillia japonica TaxID=7064 RepID=A0AAW1HUW9_POPJA